MSANSPSQTQKAQEPIFQGSPKPGTPSSLSGDAAGSRLPGFYRKSVVERRGELGKQGVLSAADLSMLASGEQVLTPTQADRMVENVIGVFGLPMGLGLNFSINGQDRLIPMVVEEPSIVAAISSAAKLVRAAGGFQSSCDESMLVGQIQVVDVAHPAKVKHAILQRRDEILTAANALHPKMVQRGGGAKDVEVFVHPSRNRAGDMLIVHLVVDTKDAMGANLVNSMCEGVAPIIEALTRGRVFLRILSNLTDRAVVRCQARLPAELLASKSLSGQEVCDGIVLANDFAWIDPYRAATHNKGIMNGIDAVALATGNDWRAVEAAAHAYAARGGRYRSLTQWYRDEEGALVGRLDIALKVGTVGGSLQSNPAVGLAHRILGVHSALDLAEVMAAVGLAQNLAALRALVGEGIQKGHMNLHARSVASTAGTPSELFDTVVARLIEGGDIKVWRATQIIADLKNAELKNAELKNAELKQESTKTSLDGAEVSHTAPKITHKAPAVGEGLGEGFGKVVLLGEHSVVYGCHALAAAIPLSVQAKVQVLEAGDDVHICVPAWDLEEKLPLDGNSGLADVANPGTESSLHRSLALMLTRLDLKGRGLRIEVEPNIPRAMGLGGSAALAVATIRALSAALGLDLDDQAVNALAFEVEKVAHGTPSGLDNTLATYGSIVLFRGGGSERGMDAKPKTWATPALCQRLQVPEPMHLVVGMTPSPGLTAATVGQVQRGHARLPKVYGEMFAAMDGLALQGAEALQAGDWERLGALMNVGHGYLNGLGVSTWELEELVGIAREHGALGAKLTGAGGGGSMVALCQNNAAAVVAAIEKAGYAAYAVSLAEGGLKQNPKATS